MAEKKYQVFISSTYTDLVDERKKVLDILLMADCIPAGMEAFVAADSEQFEVIKKVIDLCDYYVLIIGRRYGSIHPETGKSYTEMEYDYAISQGIPVLVFALEDSVPLPASKEDDNEEKRAKLHNFRLRAMNNRLASIWKSVDELAGQLAISIMKAKNSIDRPGWQRGTSYDEASLRREIMEEQEKNRQLTIELTAAKKQVEELTLQTNIAFDDCVFEIAYSYKFNDHRTKTSITVDLPTIFKITAVEMMNIALPEILIKKALEEQLPLKGESPIFSDSQLINRICLQLEALGLIRSQWNKERGLSYWGLTAKGKKLRNDLTLVRTPSAQCNE